ncbi:unnamed protein product [Closterium sp. NIES-53]
MAKGYHQKEKVDYTEFFALVVKPTMLRTLLAGAAIKGWVVKQMDVTTAFLNGILEEDIFLAQPEGFDDGSGRVWKLKKALYGLKQAPRQWYLKLREVLEEIGFTPSSADHSLFMLDEGEQRSFIVVYVDDILIFSPSSDLVKEVRLKLQDKFKCKALGDVSFYLGLHIEGDVEKRCMRVHQRKYLEALAVNFGQSEGHVATPFPSGFKCVKGPEEESIGEEERHRFHSLVGSVMYAAVNTRPDVAFATTQLARVFQCSNEEQVAAGMRVAKYLGQTPIDGLQYSRSSQGYTFRLGSGFVSGRSTRSSSKLGSSCEAEIYAGAMAAQELRWLTYLLTDLGERPRSPPTRQYLPCVTSRDWSTERSALLFATSLHVSFNSVLLPGSLLLALAPHIEVTESVTKRREPDTCASTPVRNRPVARPRPLAVPGTHGMTLRPSSVPQHVVLPQPPASSLPRVPDPESNLACSTSPTVTRLLAIVVTGPDFESTNAFSLVTELVDFAARSRLDYVASLVIVSESIYPPSDRGEPTLSIDILEDRQFELECLATA